MKMYLLYHQARNPTSVEGPTPAERRIPNCRVPDDCRDSRGLPSFMARDLMRGQFAQISAENQDTNSYRAIRPPFGFQYLD
jgi:hypothetical protein